MFGSSAKYTRWLDFSVFSRVRYARASLAILHFLLSQPSRLVETLKSLIDEPSFRLKKNAVPNTPVIY